MNLKVINIKHTILILRKLNFLKASLKEHKNQNYRYLGINEIKIDQIIDCLRSQGLEIMDLSTEEADLADVFRLLTQIN